jgi:uncharacterized protein with PIN domain
MTTTQPQRVRHELERDAARCMKCGKKLGRLTTEFVKEHPGAIAMCVPQCSSK